MQNFNPEALFSGENVGILKKVIIKIFRKLKKRRRNLSILNLRNVQRQHLEPENNEINQLSELRDIISVSAPDIPLDSDITPNFQVSEETDNLSNSQNAGSEILSVNSDENLSKTKKKRRRNLSIFNLRNVQRQNLEPENNDTNQLSELEDIITVSAPDSTLDTSYFLPNNESRSS